MIIASVIFTALTGLAFAEEIKPREVMVAQASGTAAPGGGMGGSPASAVGNPGGGLGGTTSPTGRMAPTTPVSGTTLPSSNNMRPIVTPVPPTTPGTSTQQPGSALPATGAPGAIP